jgi:hypothetical protein
MQGPMQAARPPDPTTARRTNSCADAGEPIAEGSRLAAPASLAYRQVTG